MVKFLHTGDWHLGMTRHYLSAEAQPRFSAARLDAIERIGLLATEENCEFVVVCGDVFESNHVRRQVVVRAFEKMAATPDGRNPQGDILPPAGQSRSTRRVLGLLLFDVH